MDTFQQRYYGAIGSGRWRKALIFSALAGFLVGAGAMLMRGQAGAPFTTVAATVPPAIGQPGVTLAWDTTNKLLVVTFNTANASGTISPLTTISYNPRAVEGANPAGAAFSVAGLAVLLKHNLATDPLIYQISTATAMLAQCSTTTPTPTGQVACPALPF